MRGHPCAGPAARSNIQRHLYLCASVLICLLALIIAPRCRQCAGTTGGQTPLMCAAKGASVEALKILLAHGADVQAVDDEGRTGTQQWGGRALCSIRGSVFKAMDLFWCQ